VTVLNNEEDPGFTSGEDQDSIIVLRSTGYGPNRTRVALEVEVQSPCGGTGTSGGCGNDYAQGYVNAQNTSMSGCGATNIDLSGGLRTLEVGN
jgi:hypothetical protein